MADKPKQKQKASSKSRFDLEAVPVAPPVMGNRLTQILILGLNPILMVLPFAVGLALYFSYHQARWGKALIGIALAGAVINIIYTARGKDRARAFLVWCYWFTVALLGFLLLRV